MFLLFEELIAESLDARIEEKAEEVYKRKRIEEYVGEKGQKTRSEWVKSFTSDQFVVNRDLLRNLKAPSPEQIRKMPLPQKKTLDKLANLGEEPRDGSKGTRAWFSDLVLLWNAIDTTSRNVPTIGPHKPDALHRQLQRAGEQSVRGVGEIKGGGEGDFSHEEQGQICDFLQSCLSVQPWRSFVYGYLTDCRRFEFYRASKRDAGICFERTGIILESEGWSLLRSFCCQDNVTLGYDDVHIDGWDLTTWLGTGLTSAVFYAQSTAATRITSRRPLHQQQDNAIPAFAVCKVYLDKAKGRTLRDRERNALMALSEFECIPKVVESAAARSACGRAVLVKIPRGKSIPQESRPAISDYAPIVKALQHAHTQEFFHNDIAPQNLFCTVKTNNEVTVFLNDFGSAATREEIDNGMSIASRPMYYEYGRFGAAADLLALVRSIFVLTQCTFHPATADSAAKLDAIMRNQLYFWEIALRLADTAN